MEILEMFRGLPLLEKREVAQAILTEQAAVASEKRRSLDEVLGKFKPVSEPKSHEHNHWVAEAILESKRGDEGAH